MSPSTPRPMLVPAPMPPTTGPLATAADGASGEEGPGSIPGKWPLPCRAIIIGPSPGPNPPAAAPPAGTKPTAAEPVRDPGPLRTAPPKCPKKLSCWCSLAARADSPVPTAPPAAADAAPAPALGLGPAPTPEESGLGPALGPCDARDVRPEAAPEPGVAPLARAAATAAASAAAERIVSTRAFICFSYESTRLNPLASPPASAAAKLPAGPTVGAALEAVLFTGGAPVACVPGAPEAPAAPPLADGATAAAAAAPSPDASSGENPFSEPVRRTATAVSRV